MYRGHRRLHCCDEQYQRPQGDHGAWCWGRGSLRTARLSHYVAAARMMLGGSLPLRPEYLFNQLAAPEAQRLADRCGPESPLAQYQLLFHRPAAPPRGDAPVLVLATPDDALVPIADVRRTAKRYAADIVTFPGMGHDLMLDREWRAPFDAMTRWLEPARRRRGALVRTHRTARP